MQGAVRAEDEAVVEVQRAALADGHHYMLLGHLPLAPWPRAWMMPSEM